MVDLPVNKSYLAAKFSTRIRHGSFRNDNSVSFTSKMGTVATDPSDSATLCIVASKNLTCSIGIGIEEVDPGT